MTDGGPKRHTKTYADIAASDGGPKCPHRIQLESTHRGLCLAAIEAAESNSRALTEACVWPRSKQPPDDEVKWNSCAVLLV